MLRGRAQQCLALDGLLADVRAGRSRALVVRGEPGIGKTALLGYAADTAPDFRVARAEGVESEMELPFAALHQLCGRMMNRSGCLPGPQRDALDVAFGLRSGSAPDRFLVSLAVLTLLSDVAADQPLLCLIDDAQWLDRTSAQVLAFVARRLDAESVALIFGTRDPDVVPGVAGLPKLPLEGLSDADARALLASVLPGRLDERVRDRIVASPAATRWHCLRCPAGSTAAELAGGFGVPAAPTLASRIEQSFQRRIAPLPEVTRHLLLLAAAEPMGDPALLWRAAGQLGISAGRRRPGGGRRAAYRRRQGDLPPPAGPLRRLPGSAGGRPPPYPPGPRRGHRPGNRSRSPGLASGPGSSRTRRGHRRRAGTICQPGTRARRPGGSGRLPRTRRRADASAAAHARHAHSPRRRPHTRPGCRTRPSNNWPSRRQDRSASWSAPAWSGCTHRSRSPACAAATPRSCYFGRPSGSARWTPPWPARPTWRHCGRPSAPAAPAVAIRHVETAEAARAAPPAADPPRAVDLLLDGLAARSAEGYSAGAPILRRALRALHDETGGDDTRWLWLGCHTAMDLWDDEACRTLAARHVQHAREAGALTMLPFALNYVAAHHIFAGEFTAATALLDEADAITAATGNVRMADFSLLLAAWRGQASGQFDAGVQEAAARGEGLAMASAEFATAVLHNGLGHYQAALAAAKQACEHDELGFGVWVLPELIEAGVRSGQTEIAAAALQRADPANQPQRQPMGTRHRSPLPRPHGRWTGRRGPIPGGDQPARQQQDDRTPRPRSPHLRRMAAPPEPARRRPRAAAHRTPDARLHGSRRLR